MEFERGTYIRWVVSQILGKRFCFIIIGTFPSYMGLIDRLKDESINGTQVVVLLFTWLGLVLSAGIFLVWSLP